MENSDQERLEANYHLLKSYQWDSLQNPKIILRKLRSATEHDMDFDDLYLITFDMQKSHENLEQKLPQNYKWALSSLNVLRNTYKRMLQDENERIHLEGLFKNETYLVLENIAPQTSSNIQNGDYIGGCTTKNGRPCILFVNGRLKGSTLVHESVHHSDLMLGTPHFSDLPLYQSIIMMLDAQISSSDKNNKTVQSLRTVNQIYKPGQLYIEGLPWITEMPLSDLYKEKNHLGQSLKLLHADYTKALLKNQSTIILCYSFFKPSKKVMALLQEYNKRKQRVGYYGNQILSQQKDFTNELLSFRKDIGIIERAGLGTLKMPEGIDEFCNLCGFNSLTSAVLAYQTANNLFEQTKNNPSEQIQTIQKLQKSINPSDFKNPSYNGKDLLTAAFYLQILDNYQNGLNTHLTLAEVPQSLKQNSADEIRQKLYNNVTKSAYLTMLACQTGCNKRDCELAQALQIKPQSVQKIREQIEGYFATIGDLAKKRDIVSSWITDFELNPDINEARQAQVKAAVGMNAFLFQSVANTHIHGALSSRDIQHFDISKKILSDMHYFKLEKNADGLPLNVYQNFDLGYVSELFGRDPNCFNKKNANYIPNNYESSSPQKTAYARALYELLAARHRYGSYASKDLTLTAFQPNTDFYLNKLPTNLNKTYS